MRKLLLLHIIILTTLGPAWAQEDTVNSSLKELTEALEATKAEKAVLQHINITGNRKTRRSIILREMNVAEGDSLDLEGMPDLITLNEKRIFNLSIFIEVKIHVVQTAPGIVEWEILVREQWYLIPEFTFRLADRNFNVWWVEQNRDIRRANIGVTLKNRNFRGNLEEVAIVAQVGYTQKFGLEYKRPYVDKEQKHGFGVKVFASRNEEWFIRTDSNKWDFARTPQNYITSSFEAAGNYTLRPAYASRHLFELRYKSQNVEDTVLLLNPGYFLNGSKNLQLLEFLYRYDLNMVDNWNYPMTGLKSITHIILRAGIKGFKFQNQYSTEIGYFKKLTKKLYSSHIFRGRVSFPNKQPYPYVYAMGVGSEYLRGFEYYVIDGSNYGLLRTNLKLELLNTVIRKIPMRYIATVPIRIYPKIYADVGYAANRFPGNSTMNNRALYSYGAGVDIVSFYDFKMRIEYSFNDLGEKGLFLHINNSE